MIGVDAVLPEADEAQMNTFKSWKNIFTNTAYVYQTICLLAVVGLVGFVFVKAKTNETAQKFRLSAVLLALGQVFSAMYYYTIDSSDVSSMGGKFWFNFSSQFQQAMTFLAVMFFANTIRAAEGKAVSTEQTVKFCAAAVSLAFGWTLYMTV